MDFAATDRRKDLGERVAAFMDNRVYPAEAVCEQQMAGSATRICIRRVMGKLDPGGPRHRQQSMVVVPIDTPGVTIVRNLPVFGYEDREAAPKSCSRTSASRRPPC